MAHAQPVAIAYLIEEEKAGLTVNAEHSTDAHAGAAPTRVNVDARQVVGVAADAQVGPGGAVLPPVRKHGPLEREARLAVQRPLYDTYTLIRDRHSVIGLA